MKDRIEKFGFARFRNLGGQETVLQMHVPMVTLAKLADSFVSLLVLQSGSVKSFHIQICNIGNSRHQRYAKMYRMFRNLGTDGNPFQIQPQFAWFSIPTAYFIIN